MVTRPIFTPAGTRFNSLVTLADAPQASRKVACRCDCGKETSVTVSNLRTGAVKTCGCSKAGISNGRYRHGMAGSSIYATWYQFVARCTRPSHPRYADYGGRGIAVFEPWLIFDNFYADMGDRPPGMTLDRRNNDGPYSPENCRWATYAEQSGNRRPTRLRESCPNGHEYTPENTLVTARGRTCRICRCASRVRQARRNAANKVAA